MVHSRIYIYKCNECGNEFEYQVSMVSRGVMTSSSDSIEVTEVMCPQCRSANTIRVYNANNFGFSKKLQKIDG